MKGESSSVESDNETEELKDIEVKPISPAVRASRPEPVSFLDQIEPAAQVEQDEVPANPFAVSFNDPEMFEI